MNDHIPPGSKHSKPGFPRLVRSRTAARVGASPDGPGAPCDDDGVGPTVLIVDDHADFRAFARALLVAGGFEVVGEAARWRRGAVEGASAQAGSRAAGHPAAGHRRVRGLRSARRGRDGAGGRADLEPGRFLVSETARREPCARVHPEGRPVGTRSRDVHRADVKPVMRRSRVALVLGGLAVGVGSEWASFEPASSTRRWPTWSLGGRCSAVDWWLGSSSGESRRRADGRVRDSPGSSAASCPPRCISIAGRSCTCCWAIRAGA